jgi:hypothetical protein
MLFVHWLQASARSPSISELVLPHGHERTHLHRYVRTRLPRTDRYVMLTRKDLPHPIARYKTQIA